MNEEIRQILIILLICSQIVVLSKQHTPSDNIKIGNKIIKNSENNLIPGRFSQLQGYGTVEEVEPQPKIRIYVYNPPNSFNPTNEMFSKRILREMENERFTEQVRTVYQIKWRRNLKELKILRMTNEAIEDLNIGEVYINSSSLADSQIKALDQLLRFKCSRLEKKLKSLQLKRKYLSEGRDINVSLNELISRELIEAADFLTTSTETDYPNLEVLYYSLYIYYI
ncbi:uncharacterized protein TA18200 [Theileria annulata]|uniref:Uncharacterized protein n=1 Tax=Theileria annulata TaxID=5874 RepID=Q4UB12_THEAN|nr:uncharacterized protein TA18200 [Theileria annulata]CAI75989.1 hypothetical protein TA18200 [Theileria annulata]|eukprot:XP_955465.1 hypothetical protein TA18200 [Theileria annulata]